MRARQAVVLCCCFLLLLLLWSGEQVSAMKGADLCRLWEYSQKGFQCPQWCAREDARNCCRTCRLPFCCPRREAHLDGHRGRRALPKETSATPAPPTTSSVTDANTDSWIIFLSLMVILAMTTIGFLFYHCKKRYQRWQRALGIANVYRNWIIAPYQRFLFPGSSPPIYTNNSAQYNTEDPQRNMTQPPPSQAVGFHCARAEADQEGEVTLQHLRHHQGVPGPSSEATFQREKLI